MNEILRGLTYTALIAKLYTSVRGSAAYAESIYSCWQEIGCNNHGIEKDQALGDAHGSGGWESFGRLLLRSPRIFLKDVHEHELGPASGCVACFRWAVRSVLAIKSLIAVIVG
jgi:hypothetical protein